jgi:hypothetical protein
MKTKWIVKGFEIFLLIVIIFFAVVVGLGQAVLHLWNWLMPSVFGLHPITFWQAVGIMGLSWILFGRAFLGGRSHGRPWRNRGRDRWEGMTPEERDQLRRGIQGRCGNFGASATEPNASQ